MSDVAAQVERVRALEQWMSVWAPRDHRDTLASLAAHIEKIERERDALQERLTIQNLPSVATEYASRRAEAAEREAKRSERYAEDRDLVAQEFERRVEALEATLREIAALTHFSIANGVAQAPAIARRALSPEPYADVPGAGQRGC